MAALKASPEIWARRHCLVQSWLLLALFLIAPNIPRPSVIFPFLLGAVSIYYFVYVRRDLTSVVSGTEERLFLAVIFSFSGYLFINSFLSASITVALGKAAYVACLIILCLVIIWAFSSQSQQTLSRTARFAVYGALAGTLFACLEFATDHYLARMLYTHVPITRPGDNTIKVLVRVGQGMETIPESEFRQAHGDVEIKVNSSALNRNLSLLILLFWPVLSLALQSLRDRFGILSASLIAAVTSITVFISDSQTAQVALVIGMLVFIIARVKPVFVHRSVLVGWCVAVVLALPLASAPYNLGLQKATWIPDTFRDRMTIWAVTAEQAKKTPLFGIGIRSTRVLNKEIRKTQVNPGEVAPLRLGLHAHNQFVQAWFELGAIGAALILAVGLGLLHAIRNIGQTVQPYAYAAFVSACAIAGFGWGLWQTWLITGYFLSIMLVCLASALSSARDRAVETR